MKFVSQSSMLSCDLNFHIYGLTRWSGIRKLHDKVLYVIYMIVNLRQIITKGASRRLFTTSATTISKDKVVVTCSVNGVLTDPSKFSVPVTPKEMAKSCREAFDEGATIAHIHFRDQRDNMGHFPTWDPKVASDIAAAIRKEVPEMLLNFTTGTMGDGRDHSVGTFESAFGGGELGPCDGPISCLDGPAAMPEMAALNSGSLNYLRTRSDGKWAWDPLMFENRVEKIEIMINAMKERGIVPECECFDTGIVRSIRMYEEVGLLKPPYNVSLVMGVASGMSCDPRWVPLLAEEIGDNVPWQVIAIGREEVWDTLHTGAELGGNVRTGLEDTFYLPNGSRATSNGQLINALVGLCRDIGREPATPEETRELIGWNKLN
jgi:3-keto-5-aminohexanoate cleavage enzyme